jgi:hypothetical protein
MVAKHINMDLDKMIKDFKEHGLLSMEYYSRAGVISGTGPAPGHWRNGM